MEKKLRESEQWLATILKSIGDAVIATDSEGFVTFMNPVAEVLTGWKQEDAAGKPLKKVFHIRNEITGKQAENPVTRVLREGIVVGLANHTVVDSQRWMTKRWSRRWQARCSKY
jgi:PAS domain-containing protein